uniref:DUF1618 domain-containing protein n=1 Tax=Oryza rufipogon TaxID=4529 RepID=A0A0E0NVW5_ORYRU
MAPTELTAGGGGGGIMGKEGGGGADRVDLHSSCMDGRHQRKHRVEERGDEIDKRQAKKARKTSADLLLLDHIGYQDESQDDGGSTWTAPMVTSRGVRFQLSLRPKEPPDVSRMLFKAVVPADILTSYDPNNTANPFLRPSARFVLIVISSNDKAILLQALCAVAGLERRRSEEGWHVFFLSTSTNIWRRKLVCLAPDHELRDYHWEVSSILTYRGRFWWVDLRRGLLSCSCDSLLLEDDIEATTQQPLDLDFTLLPNVTMEEAKEARLSEYPLQRDRCVGISSNGLRYVEVRAHRHRCPSKSPVAPPPLCDDCRADSITSWVLYDHSGAWAEERTLKLADGRELPIHGSLIDPFDGNIVYFSINEGKVGDGREFCVHLRTKQIKACSSSYKGLNDGALEPVFTASLKSTRNYDVCFDD